MTEKRFTIIYGVDEDPYEWDLMDNEKDVLICRCNGKPICDLLNGQHEELQKRKKIIKQITKDYNELKQINTRCNERYRELADENEGLKQALLFFLDVANTECSSSFEKDMEHDCQKLFNCSYNEAKKKYGGYNGT